MMSKVFKNIPVFFLWIAWLVLTAHLIIPHDHHLSDSFSHQEESCPVSNGKTGHLPGFPVHCHAFNDLTSEKATICFVKRNIRYNDSATSSFFDSFTFDFQFPPIAIIDFREPIINSHFLELAHLRAPPSLS
jgi:hypothetical protein